MDFPSVAVPREGSLAPRRLSAMVAVTQVRYWHKADTETVASDFRFRAHFAARTECRVSTSASRAFGKCTFTTGAPSR
jgi:hypothetical protein